MMVTPHQSGGEMAPILIEFAGVNKHFNALHVLKDIDLTIHHGEVLAICGPSGSGKSTLIRCINGLEMIDAGKLRVLGHALGPDTSVPRSLRAEIGMVFQNFALYPHLNVLKNITLAPVKTGRMTKTEAEEQAHALLARVGIPEKADQHPAQLSGGQRQRVAIARALAMEPKIMLFDEPTSALDPEMVKEVLDVIGELATGGMTMIVVTHQMGFARNVASRIAFMDAGRIVEINTPDQFFKQPQDERTQQFLSKILSV